MEVTIYGDVVFLVNFCMDFLILWITAILQKNNISYKRIFLGSLFLSSIYCIALIFSGLSFFCHGIGGMILFVLGIEITFFPKTIKKLVQYFLIGNIVAFAIGGVAMALFFATGNLLSSYITLNVRQFPVKILIATVCFFYILIKIGKNWITTNIINRKNYCSVVVKQKGIQIPLHMLIDTGNSLKDPFSGDYVAVAAFPAIKNLFSKEIQFYFFKEYQNQQKFYEYVLEKEKTLALHFIPFSSLGKENGLLLVFQPEILEIEGSIKKNISLGIYCGSFSGGYDGLVSPEILT